MKKTEFNFKNHFLVVWLVMLSPWSLAFFLGGIELRYVIGFVVLEIIAAIIALGETYCAARWGTPVNHQ